MEAHREKLREAEKLHETAKTQTIFLYQMLRTKKMVSNLPLYATAGVASMGLMVDGCIKEVFRLGNF